MTLAMIVGAGFSRAISSHLPLTGDLCEVLRREDQDPRQLEALPALRDGQDLERWLSVLAEPQPYLDEAENAGNAQQFVYATRVIRQTIDAGQGQAMSRPIPTWLDRLIRFLHVEGHTVISFNYDTLLECATTSLMRSIPGHGTVVPAFNRQRVREQPPVYFEPQGLTSGRQRVPTYTLLKLHGSLDTWWVRGDVTGETIGRIPPTAWGAEPDPRLWDPDLQPAGKELFIVPPASAKSAYYANPVSRQLWQDAHAALEAADEICIFGYSFPLTDLTIGNMVSSALNRTAQAQRVEVVDVNPTAVAGNLERLGIDRNQIQETSATSGDQIEEWVEHLVQGVDLNLYPPG
jgi:hypothetical protein